MNSLYILILSIKSKIRLYYSSLGKCHEIFHGGLPAFRSIYLKGNCYLYSTNKQKYKRKTNATSFCHFNLIRMMLYPNIQLPYKILRVEVQMPMLRSIEEQFVLSIIFISVSIYTIRMLLSNKEFS